MISKSTLLKTVSLVVVSIFLIGSAFPTSGAYDDELFPKRDVTITANAEASASNSLWMLPGLRSLDPDVFGTPEQPLMTDMLPEAARNTTESGDAYTTTIGPTPFSNKTLAYDGSISVTVSDLTESDTPNSNDTILLEANFTDPQGVNDYFVDLQKTITVGPDHPFFGGVGTNVLMHGSTGIGTPLMPRVHAYSTLWGFGDFYINNTLEDSNRLIHFMLTQRLRTQDNNLGFDVSDPNDLEIHFIMPNIKVTQNGPIQDPLPTHYTLPNGMDQPFMHINFYDITAKHDGVVITDTITTTTTVSQQRQTVTTTEAPGLGIFALISTIVILVPLVRKLDHTE